MYESLGPLQSGKSLFIAHLLFIYLKSGATTL